MATKKRGEEQSPPVLQYDSQAAMLTIKPHRAQPVAGVVSVASLQQIFQKHNITAISLAAIESLTHEINRPWRMGYKHGNWELHVAIRIILDDVAVAVTAERGHLSQDARKREMGYSMLLEGARILQESGVKLPAKSDKPPKTKQAESKANPDYRDWFFIFDAVCRTFNTANLGGKSLKSDSPAILITCCILRKLKIVVSEDSLTQALKRRKRATKRAEPYRLTSAKRPE